MRRNAAGQKIQAMMRTTSAVDTRIVEMATKSVSGATNATPIVVTTSAAHGIIPGMVVTIASVGGNTAANGTHRVIAVGSTTTFSLGDTTDGTNVAGNGAYTSGGTVTIYPVAVMVVKDGGAPAFGTGTLSHIGRSFKNAAHSGDTAARRSTAATAAATASVAGNLQVTAANGGVSASTLGLWSYSPTAGETNAASVAFTFASAVDAAIAVTQTFEPTSGPILLQTTIATLASQTSFTLTAGAPDDDTYNGCLCVVYDSATEAQVAIGVISDYAQTTKTVSLLAAPLNTGFTMAAGDFVTIIADPGLKPATANRTLVVDASGLADANTVKIGPTGSGTAQTAGLDLNGIIPDSIPSDGTRPTISQSLYMLTQFMTERAVSSTTVTVKKVDGSTSLFTLTLSDATTPVSITRAT